LIPPIMLHQAILGPACRAAHWFAAASLLAKVLALTYAANR
jgi:hypothetical protein